MSSDNLYLLSPLTALSPLDGRYAEKTNALREIFSEFGLIHRRIRIEIAWLEQLSSQSNIQEVASLTTNATRYLHEIYENFSLEDAQYIKEIELTTNHDVKAVEYYLKERLNKNKELSRVSEFVHFACTSEDINNLAYALMLNDARNIVLIPAVREIKDALRGFAMRYADQPMLARTHGQPASPTTVGKEFGNFAARLRTVIESIEDLTIPGKFNGAVGNFNAHYIAYPEIDWPTISKDFVEALGLNYQSMTTQIEPHDGIAQFCHELIRLNNILLDLDRDLWGYIALGYFDQQLVDDEIGSSTMPHKINPIDFENSEGNIGLANALLGHLAEKLPISRWQRDLSDSTAMRSLGVGLGYSLIAWRATSQGLSKLQLNSSLLNHELEESWIILAEAIQTVMRRYGITDAYEQLKVLTRGQNTVTKESMQSFIRQLPIPHDARKRLINLTPHLYTGNAAKAAKTLDP
tara:strand:+ start:3530 stop:4924 length:1395 start_codon:yes stop_codon:yes gene_type:complete